ncbi:hypothetical protein C8R43DRAFT_950461 [Mycena crocata]|nr:hypothetical protein C8R43DRAFT_958980 [Mycena crocata]KAJ7123840.1 hypothetical protein C8R43DRAFT_958987 [Mycena crocata]KAJ7153051.1 hypothetical protein C8R43DRAFT_950461 [Mycena crocata]
MRRVFGVCGGFWLGRPVWGFCDATGKGGCGKNRDGANRDARANRNRYARAAEGLNETQSNPSVSSKTEEGGWGKTESSERKRTREERNELELRASRRISGYAPNALPSTQGDEQARLS